MAAGRYVYSHARALDQHSSFDLVGAVDPCLSAREVFMSVYGRPAYATIAEASTAHEYSVAVIASPTDMHESNILELLHHGAPRYILCEKPLADTIISAERIMTSCSASTVQVFVNYMRRSEPGALDVAKRFDFGAIVTPVKGVAWYTKGLLHNGSHLMNLLERWLGPVKKWTVQSHIRDLPGGDAELDVRVVFEKGEVTFLAANSDNYAYHAVELVACNGRLRYDRGGEIISWVPRASPPTNHGGEVLSKNEELIKTQFDRYQWFVTEALAKRLSGSDSEICTGAEALATLSLITQMIGKDPAHVA